MTARIAVLAVTLLLGGCAGLYFGDDPGRAVGKQTGPLTAPPASALNGTARD